MITAVSFKCASVSALIMWRVASVEGSARRTTSDAERNVAREFGSLVEYHPSGRLTGAEEQCLREMQEDAPAINITCAGDNEPVLRFLLTGGVRGNDLGTKCYRQSRCLASNVAVSQDADGLATELLNEQVEPESDIVRVVRPPGLLSLSRMLSEKVMRTTKEIVPGQ
jgi:hypothetical protein